MPASNSNPRPASAEEFCVSRAGVWFALLGGGSAWMLHLLLAYVIAEFGCLAGLGERHVAGLSVVAWLLLIATALTLALAGTATAVAWRLRRSEREGPQRTNETQAALAFSGRLALVSDVVFLLVIAVQSVPIFHYLRSC